MTWSRSADGLLLTVLLCAGPSVADAQGGPRAPLVLALPVDCDMERDCSIQKYVDRDPGPERLDYRCGALTTDGHDGTDFRLRRPWDFGLNVKVLAAAPGVVARVRDGVPDISVKDPAAPPVRDRMAGNAVVIRHDGGWETQYSHLKQGSVQVIPGTRVVAGTVLGAIGMSGNAEFAHLHFEIRHAGKAVDPFASASSEGCAISTPGLWSPAAVRSLTYKHTEILSADFADSPQAALEAYQKTDRSSHLQNKDMLLIWGMISGIRSEDIEIFRIYAPDGGLILESKNSIKEPSLQRVGYAAVRRPATGWAPGVYRGSYSLIRKDKIMGEVHVSRSLETAMIR
ncbi:M23 family metallopeptidase [Sphingobium subterraneum]|uniref:Murein DD-endopeptidase MepM/ murein hydrolase activator NlpD n=1 Tax=Sphingobium subterraneum TaxID=627688 RepID=A0A841J598_9SPHN|nr:M23 family metallopeptidase [Sphingobium subterraneum]MBB6123718.1 murein DD-endopeptidase MepM/ murein hydrolase activator NlpD [Sphingobium subterraneum]